MINERLQKRVRQWSSIFLLGVGVCTVLGIGYVRLNKTTSESHLVRRAAADQLTPSIIHIETGYIIDNSNKEEKLYFQGVKEARDFVKYQYPSEKFVPLDELVTVLLNGMRFYHQGDEMLPKNETSGPMKADTRANEHNMRCEGRDDFKAYRREHAVKSMPHDVAPVTVIEESEISEAITHDIQAAVVVPQDTPIAAAIVDEVVAGKSNDNTDTSSDDDQAAPSSSNFDDASARSVQDLAFLESVMSFFGDETTTSANDATVADTVADTVAPVTAETAVATEADAAPQPRNHRIGCCNGVPYNQNKRCCCRRIAFDKDKKFCCAINGCANFKVFDRANPKNYDLCLSLQGLVVQEYGYMGEHAELGEPDLTRTPRARPRE